MDLGGLAVGDATAVLGPRGRVLLIIDDPEREFQVSPEELVRSFNLSLAEARVALHATAAVPVDKIAQRLSLSRNTVKTHLKVIYLKTGVQNQSDSVRLIGTST